MTVLKQYSDLITSDIFVEYKTASTERKKELEDFVFKTLRSINTFPEYEVTFNEKVKSLNTLVSMDPWESYNNGLVSSNSMGSILCSIFYPNIYDVTKPPDFPRSVKENFYQDNVLKRAITKTLSYSDNITDIVNWIRMIRSGYCNNFKPSAAKVIYDTNLSKGSKVLDYASGYGGRILGAWSSVNVSEYVGIEPNSETNANGHKFYEYLSDYGDNLSRFELHKIGSEDFTIQRFPHFKGYFDMAFSSPQYFNTEVYSTEETQSCIKFNDYSNWVKGFLSPTINNCIDMLKPDGIFAINIFERLGKIKSLVAYICRERDFYMYKEDFLSLAVMPGTGKGGEIRKKTDGKSEPIWYFKKKEYI